MAVALANTFISFLFAVKISLSSFKVYNTVLLATITVVCSRIRFLIGWRDT